MAVEQQDYQSRVDRLEDEFRTLLGELAFRFRTDKGEYDPASRVCLNMLCGNNVRHPHVLTSMDRQAPPVESVDKKFDRLAADLTDNQMKALFNEFDTAADSHGPMTRQLYMALYRRWHG